jgi:dephospho-CoA kinase
MLKIGLTGGIGSGKSVIAKVFVSLGIPVYQADQRAKLLVGTSVQLKSKIINEFGEEAFNEQGYNPGYMADIVFQHNEKLQLLNNIIHPFVADDFALWCVQYSEKQYVINEAAILYESGTASLMDYVIAVNAPIDLRIKRVLERDKTSPEQVMQRINNQWPADKINSMADWVVLNDDKTLILPQIIKIHKQLLIIISSHA